MTSYKNEIVKQTTHYNYYKYVSSPLQLQVLHRKGDRMGTKCM